MVELWSTFEENNKYWISSEGRIYSEIKNRFLNGHVNANGYTYVVLTMNDGTRKMFTVHRLVAKTFIKPVSGCDLVNHKDEIKSNNSASNLEWCTKAYNNTYNGKTQRCCKKIIMRDPKTGNEKVWGSAREASNAGIANYKNISACCRNLRNFAGGYEWRFYNG